MSLLFRLKEVIAKQYLATFLLIWSLLIAASVSWNFFQNYHDTLEKARIEARTIFQHNLAYRKWNAMHGGIYTRIANNNKSNPHLILSFPDQDGRMNMLFGMIDSNQMTKQAYDLLHEQAPTLATISRTISLNPSPTQEHGDDPDPWERSGLLAFEQGLSEEISQIALINDRQYLRLLKPYKIEQGCLTCHGPEQLKIGDVRGGMSLAVPMHPYYESATKTKRIIATSHMLLWLLGSLAIFKFFAAYKRHQTAITESEAKFRIVSECAYNLEYWMRENNTLTFISPSCFRLTGYTPEEFLARPKLLLEIIHPEDAEAYRKHLTDITAPEHEGTEHRIVTKSGEVRWVSHSCSPIYVDGKFLGRRGSSMDISDHKLLEQQLRQAKQVECLGQFAGGIAHDFNNVLASITTFSQLLQDEVKSCHPEAADYVKYIMIAAKLGKNLTSNLLSFGKKQIINPRRVRINSTINNISDILKNLITEDVVYTISLSEEESEIFADSHQIEQILINLCINARDAMPNGGNITITTQQLTLAEERVGVWEKIPAGSYMVLAIADTGHGIDAQHIHQICEPFFTTKGASKGSGLGLSIIYNIVKQHSAFLDLESTVGVGTTFSIYLPAIVAAEAGAETSSDPENQPELSGSNHKKTILLADDDELIRKSLGISLELKGYRVILAEDGARALSLYLDHQKNIDMVILDVVLPKKNGRQVFDVIKRNNPAVKALFISGYTSDIMTGESIDREGLNFLSKPLDIKLFLTTVKNILDSLPV